MKKLAFAALVSFLLSFSVVAYAHSGDTDANGGHYNHKTGQYHYHSPKKGR